MKKPASKGMIKKYCVRLVVKHTAAEVVKARQDKKIDEMLREQHLAEEYVQALEDI